MASPEPSMAANLRYVGPQPADVGFVLPLEEGWSAVDHFEADEAVYARKVATGFFAAVRAQGAGRKAKEEEVSGGDSTAEL